MRSIEAQQIPLIVGVAGDDRGGGRLLAKRAQGRGRAQLSRLDQNERVGRIVENGFERRGKIATAGADAHDPAAAEQAEGSGLVLQETGIRRDGVALERDDGEGIAVVAGRGGKQRRRALANEPGIGTVNQDDGTSRIGAGEEAVDVAGAERDHGRSARQPRSRKNEATRARICSATTLAARFSASRKARTRA